MTRWRYLALPVAICLGSLAACGTDGTSHADLVAAANRVCAESNASLGKLFSTLFANGDEEPSAAKAAPVLAEAVGIAQHEAAALGHLDAPDADRAALGRVHDAFIAVSVAGRRAAALAANGDQSYLAALAATNDTAAHARAVAVKAGFVGCRS